MQKEAVSDKDVGKRDYGVETWFRYERLCMGCMRR